MVCQKIRVRNEFEVVARELMEAGNGPGQKECSFHQQRSLVRFLYGWGFRTSSPKYDELEKRLVTAKEFYHSYEHTLL